MSDSGSQISRQWLMERLRRHLSELLRMAAPIVMMRVGLVSLGMVDTAMVGHYATEHLAWLNLANQSVIMFTLVVGLGLLGGVTVYVANALGEDNPTEAGRVWRRSMPFAALVGLALFALSWPAEYWLTLLGQTPEKAAEGGRLARILALGLPAHMLFVCSTMFLEGIRRGHVGFFLMIGANILNAGLNYILIFGLYGMPELGAAGSAWTSTVIRWLIAFGAIGYVWWSPHTRAYKVREPHGQHWRDWRDQRTMGYASAVSLAAEVLAFGALSIFAGWLGTVPLAAHGVIFQVVGIPLMISIGFGVAASVRVGIAYGRRDKADTALAGLSGMGLNFCTVGIFGGLILLFTDQLLGIFTSDIRIIDLVEPFVFVCVFGMVFDASQMVASMILRGFKETWWPTAFQAIAFICVMLPACYFLAFPMERGLRGLMEGMSIGVMVAWALQALRFRHLVRTRT